MLVIAIWIEMVPKQFDRNMYQDQADTEIAAAIRKQVFCLHFVKFAILNVKNTLHIIQILLKTPEQPMNIQKV